jgi:uncharacterized membrane protein
MPENTQTMPAAGARPVPPAPDGDDGDRRTGLVLGAALVAMAFVAGLCFTFTVAVMPALADADDRTFVATMQRFNDNPVFPITFIGALPVAALAAVMQRRQGRSLALRWTVAALVLHGVVLAITFGLHVPLNDDIDEAGEPEQAAELAELAELRDDVEAPWVIGNVPRTLLSTAAVAALGWSMFLHGPRATARAEHTDLRMG